MYIHYNLCGTLVIFSNYKPDFIYGKTYCTNFFLTSCDESSHVIHLFT